MKLRYGLATAVMTLLACNAQPVRMEITGGSEPLNFYDVQGQNLRVEVFDGDGRLIENPRLKWTSISPRIASVTDDGMIIPGADGRTRIIVRAGYVERQIPVNVEIHDRVEVVPNVLLLNAGDVRALNARVFDRQARTVHGALVTWTVADSKIAEIDERGTLSGVAPGSTTLIVRSAGAGLELPVEVGAMLEDAS